MTELINDSRPLPYNPDTTGWEPDHRTDEIQPRPAPARVRFGYYLHPETGERIWGDHRTTWSGTTCTEVCCYTSHHPQLPPGWPEPTHPDDPYDYQSRPGVEAIVAGMWGWSNGGRAARLTQAEAAAVAHVALDALRDAGYTIIPPPGDTLADPTVPPTGAP